MIDWSSPDADSHVKPNPVVDLDEIVSGVGGPTARVLDFGCGFGRLAEHFDDYIGVDIAPHRIQQAREKYPSAEFICAPSFEDEDWPERDAIIFCDVLMHTPDEQAERILTAARTSAPRIAISEHLQERNPKREGYSYHRTLEQYEDMLAALGYQLLEALPVYNPKYGTDLHVLVFQV